MGRVCKFVRHRRLPCREKRRNRASPADDPPPRLRKRRKPSVFFSTPVSTLGSSAPWIALGWPPNATSPQPRGSPLLGTINRADLLSVEPQLGGASVGKLVRRHQRRGRIFRFKDDGSRCRSFVRIVQRIGCHPASWRESAIVAAFVRLSSRTTICLNASYAVERLIAATSHLIGPALPVVSSCRPAVLRHARLVSHLLNGACEGTALLIGMRVRAWARGVTYVDDIERNFKRGVVVAEPTT